jgi:hypothetical protein
MNRHMTSGKCIECGQPVNWRDQRRQFARAIQTYGLTPEQAKQVMPRCQKCTTW